MALRRIPIRQVGVRVTTFMGADRELTMLAGLISFAIIVPAVDQLRAWVAGLALWSASLFVLRLMAKADPLMRRVFLRHREYAPYYPARSTPWRDNRGQGQGLRYGTPGESKRSV